jgi:hypothetical protein
VAESLCQKTNYLVPDKGEMSCLVSHRRARTVGKESDVDQQLRMLTDGQSPCTARLSELLP